MPDEQDQEITLERLQADLDATTNNWKRALADFENYKRRKEAENRELVEFAREVAVVKLLPILDSLEQALRHMPEYSTTPSPSAKATGDTPPIPGGDLMQLQYSPPEKEEYPAKQGEVVNDFAKIYQNFQTGINGILQQLDKTLAELGVKKIEALGKKFDPHFHEAVREVESEADDGIIIDELQTGFMLNGKVIRPSQVVISKKAIGNRE